MDEVTAKCHVVGNAEAWFAHRGFNVLCDKLIRARRFKTEEAALKAGRAANPADFH